MAKVKMIANRKHIYNTRIMLPGMEFEVPEKLAPFIEQSKKARRVVNPSEVMSETSGSEARRPTTAPPERKSPEPSQERTPERHSSFETVENSGIMSPTNEDVSNAAPPARGRGRPRRVSSVPKSDEE